MGNSIRTPREGVTASSRRIAQAVDNEDWQKFRVSMKGKPTAEKIGMLRDYYGNHEHLRWNDEKQFEDVCIRVDNYIKALCRGGQLIAGLSLASALERNWELPIRRSI